MFNGHRVPVWDDRQVLETDSGNDCTTPYVYLMSLNCHLKIVKMVCHVHFITMKIKDKIRQDEALGCRRDCDSPGRRGLSLGYAERGPTAHRKSCLHRGVLSPSAWSRPGDNDSPVDEECSYGLQSHTCHGDGRAGILCGTFVMAEL